MPIPPQAIIADDEPMIRRVVARRLEALGYKVFCAANGVEALREFEANPGVELMLLDLDMPGKSGLDVYCEVTEQPDAPRIVIMSGYDLDDTVACFAHADSMPEILSKPFGGEAIAGLLATS